MRPRHPIRLLCTVLCTGALGLAASGCGSTQATLDPIAQAADATSHAGGSQVAIEVTMTAPSLGISSMKLQGTGDFNLRDHEGQLSLSIEGLPASAGAGNATFNELFAKGDLYMSSSLLEGKLPNGARWMKLDLSRIATSIGADPSSITGGGQDPSQYLQYLRGSGGSVRAVGHETVRGVETTRYEGTVDLRKVAEQAPATNRAAFEKAIGKLISQSGAGSFPVSVWIDAHHLLRRMTMGLPIGAHGVDASVEAEFFGFGATPAVTPPPASQTFDATQQSLQGLSSAG